MATKITWLYLFTGISLSQPMIFTYQLIPNGLFSDIPNLIHLLLEIGFSIPHYWEALQPSFYYSFDFYLPTSHLLGCNLSWFNYIEISISSYSFTIASPWRGHLIDQVWLTWLLWEKLTTPVPLCGLWHWGQQKTQQTGVQIVRTDLGSEAWANMFCQG